MKLKKIIKSTTELVAVKEDHSFNWKDLVWENPEGIEEIPPRVTGGAGNGFDPASLVSVEIDPETLTITEKNVAEKVGHHRMTMLEALAQESVNNYLSTMKPELPGNELGFSTLEAYEEEQERQKVAQEKKTDDLYDCPRKCGTRLEWKDLQTHIQAGCEVKTSQTDSFVLQPGDGVNTQFGSLRNPYRFPIKISVEKHE